MEGNLIWKSPIVMITFVVDHNKIVQFVTREPAWMATMMEGLTCLRWFFRIVPSGSGSSGSSASTLAGVNLFESRSTIQISSGNLAKGKQIFIMKGINHFSSSPKILFVHQKSCGNAYNESEIKQKSLSKLTRAIPCGITHGVGAKSNCSAQLRKE